MLDIFLSVFAVFLIYAIIAVLLLGDSLGYEDMLKHYKSKDWDKKKFFWEVVILYAKIFWPPALLPVIIYLLSWVLYKLFKSLQKMVVFFQWYLSDETDPPVL